MSHEFYCQNNEHQAHSKNDQCVTTIAYPQLSPENDDCLHHQVIAQWRSLMRLIRAQLITIQISSSSIKSVKRDNKIEAKISLLNECHLPIFSILKPILARWIFVSQTALILWRGWEDKGCFNAFCDTNKIRLAFHSGVGWCTFAAADGQLQIWNWFLCLSAISWLSFRNLTTDQATTTST